MIFYSLFTIYPKVDKTNIILTAIIIYIIIYIGLDEDYNYVCILVISVIDFILWKYFKNQNPRKKKRNGKKRKHVRFSPVKNVKTINNRYSYEDFENQNQNGFFSPQQAQMTQLNAPLWGMMTRQINPFKLKTNIAPAIHVEPVKSMQNVLIDNRHLAFKETEEYLNSDLESSSYSDSSSDMSNEEEEY